MADRDETLRYMMSELLKAAYPNLEPTMVTKVAVVAEVIRGSDGRPGLVTVGTAMGPWDHLGLLAAGSIEAVRLTIQMLDEGREQQ